MNEDYFELLGLVPSCQDTREIQDAIGAKKKEWTRDSQHPTKKRRATELLGMLGKIQAVMLDASQREFHRSEVTARRQVATQDALKALRDDLGFMTTADKGAISRVERDTLIQMHCAEGALLTAADIDRTIADMGIVVADASTQPSAQETPAMSDSDVNAIGTDLAQMPARPDSGLRPTSLYEFLCVGSQASVDEIKRRQQDRRSEWNTKREDSTKAAALTLIAKCGTILLDPKKRQSYDAALRARALRPLEAKVLLAAADKAVTAQETAHLLEIAERDFGVGHDEALELIRRVAMQRGASIEVPAIQQSARSRKCGYCGRSYPTGTNICSACNKPLQIACFECGATYPSERGACASCGLTLSDDMEIQRLVGEVKRHESAGETDELRTLLASAKGRFPRSKQIARIQSQYDAIEQLVAEGLKRVQALFAERRLEAARAELQVLAGKAPGSQDVALAFRQVNAALARVRVLIEQAERVGSEDQMRLVAQAYQLCSDSSLVKALAERSRPEPPGSVSVAQQGGMLIVTWVASSGLQVDGYRVVRKTGSAPVRLDDGVQLAFVPLVRFEDRTAPVGEVVYYAVFAERAGAVSSGVRCSIPVVRTAPPNDVVAMSQDGMVKLVYRMPKGACGIAAFKSESGPVTVADPKRRIPSASLQGFVDTSVVNGHSYHYAVAAEFETPRGLVLSELKGVVACPKPLPAPVRDLSAAWVNTCAQLEWTAPSSTRVVLVRTTTPSTRALGSTVDVGALPALGAVLNQAIPGRASDSVPSGGVYYYTAVTLEGDVGVVGSTARVVCVDDVAGLTAENEAGTLVLRWAWPRGATSARVLMRTDADPTGPDDSKAMRAAISDSDYSSVGRFVSDVTQPGAYRIAVYAVYNTPEGECVASGSSVGAHTMGRAGQLPTVTYQLRKPLLGNTYKLVFSGPAGLVLPAVMVVAKPGSWPTERSDGTCIFQGGLPPLGSGSAAVELSCPPRHHSLKVFFADDGGYSQVQLVPPSAATLRVV